MLTALATAAVALAVPADSAGSDRTAKRADGFVESVGVNVHLGYTDTVYHRHDRVQDKLVKLGVRYIRDGVSAGQPWVYETYRSLAARGIKANLLLADPFGSATIRQQLALVKRELLPALASIEGPNEYNCRDPRRNWAMNLRRFQASLYWYVKTDRALSRVPVLGPTLCDAEASDALGNISRVLDYGNIHTYPGGKPPDDDSDRGPRYHLRLAAKNSGSKPVQVTETGYHNAVRLPPTFGHPPVSEATAAVYMPRLYLEYFRRGFARTYSYELLDMWPNRERNDNEKNFGLLRNDFSEKPAFTALRRLIALLRDPGPRFATRKLDYSIQGAPPSLRQLLLQKRDGSFYIALWNQTSVWNLARLSSLNPRGDTVRVKLGRTARKLEVYRPNQSARSRLRRSNARSLRIRLSAKVTVVKVTP